jgi:hypothetical protein
MTTNRTAFIRLTSILPMLALTLGVMGWGTFQAITDNMPVQKATDAEVMAIRPHAEGSPAGVLARHEGECWRGTDPALAPLPGAAILQMQGGAVKYTTKKDMVSSAFDEALASAGYGDHEDARFVVVALCI